jgi:hypothetical protein
MITLMDNYMSYATQYIQNARHDHLKRSLNNIYYDHLIILGFRLTN